MVQKTIQRVAIKISPKCKIFCQQLSTISQQLVFLLIDVVNAEEGAGEGGGFSESHKQSFVDLALGVNEDAAKEQYQTSYREDKGCDEL